MAEEIVPGVPPADEDAGGIVPESVGEGVPVAGGVLSVGDAAGDEDVADDEADGEADVDGEADAAPDGLVRGDGDTAAGVAEGDTEQYGAGRVGDGLGIRDVQVPLVGFGIRDVQAPLAVLRVGEGGPMAVRITTGPSVPLALPCAETLHLSGRVVPGDGEEPFPVPLLPWELCPPPGKVPFPFVVPLPPPFAPRLLFPVSTVEPTCTMASRNGGTARLRHAMNAMPARMATTGRNGCRDG